MGKFQITSRRPQALRPEDIAGIQIKSLVDLETQQDASHKSSLPDAQGSTLKECVKCPILGLSFLDTYDVCNDRKLSDPHCQ